MNEYTVLSTPWICGFTMTQIFLPRNNCPTIPEWMVLSSTTPNPSYPEDMSFSDSLNFYFSLAVCVCVCVRWVVEGGAVIVSPFIWAYCSLALLVFIAVSVSPSLSILHNLVFHSNYNYLFMFPSIFLLQSLPSSVNSYNVMSPCSCFSDTQDFLICKLLAEIIFFNLPILRHSSALLSPDYPSSLEAPQGWVENSHAGHPTWLLLGDGGTSLGCTTT